MLYTKMQPQSFLGSGEEVLLSVFTNMGMATILINGPWPFVQIFYPPLTKGTTLSLKKIGREVSEEKSFKGVNRRRTTDDRRRTDGRQVITMEHPEPKKGRKKMAVKSTKPILFS